MMYAMEFHDVSRLYGDARTVDGVSIAINDGESFFMLGLSGSGKTTCLRLTAGFEQLPDGVITIFGKQASELPLWEWDVNTVFQDYALLLHMSILGNVAYGLMVKSVDKKRRHAKAREASGKVALGFVYGRRPSQLPGGQWQRVAIAWALINEPRVLLLDEPLGVLDLKLREWMQLELKKSQQSLGITSIFVIHDQGEVLLASDRAAAFNSGRIEQVDSPRGLYMRPRTSFVASFAGTSNVLDATMSANVCGLQGMFSPRLEHIRLSDAGGKVQTTGVIQAVQYQGAATRLELKLTGSEKLLASQANLTDEMLPPTLSPGQQVVASRSRDTMAPLVEKR